MATGGKDYGAGADLLMGLMETTLLASPLTILTFLIVVLYAASLLTSRNRNIAGRGTFEPTLWTCVRFFRHAKSNIDQGYKQNLLGKYTTLDTVLKSDLHGRVLQTRLTPNLKTLIPLLKDELEVVMAEHFPAGNGTEISLKIYPICLNLISHMSARLFVGLSLCRDERWINLCVSYAENVFRAVILVCLYPSFLQPLVSFFTPYTWFIRQNRRSAERIISPLVSQRRKEQAHHDVLPNEKSKDLLQWMMDPARGDKGEPQNLAHEQLLIA
ncbi:MAG: hypothetical protein Q9218_006273, partial [Villophora microphyllina]